MGPDQRTGLLHGRTRPCLRAPWEIRVGRPRAARDVRPTGLAGVRMRSRIRSGWPGCRPGGTGFYRLTVPTMPTPVPRSWRPARPPHPERIFTRPRALLCPYLYRTEFWAATPEQKGECVLRHLGRMIQSEGSPRSRPCCSSRHPARLPSSFAHQVTWRGAGPLRPIRHSADNGRGDGWLR